MKIQRPTAKNKPFILEVLGPSGAGKSTLVRALGQRSDEVRADFCLIPGTFGYSSFFNAAGWYSKITEFWGFLRGQQRYLPIFIRSAVLLLPYLLLRYRVDKRPTWSEIKEMIYIDSLRYVLERPVPDKSTVIVLDQGALFLLAWLNLYGSEGTKSQNFKRWSDRAITQWTDTLDLLVWLDAPDTTLIERVYARESAHRIKGQPEKDAHMFLAHYRAAYDHIVAQLAQERGPTVLRFDTTHNSPEQIMNAIRATLAEHHIYI